MVLPTWIKIELDLNAAPLTPSSLWRSAPARGAGPTTTLSTSCCRVFFLSSKRWLKGRKTLFHCIVNINHYWDTSSSYIGKKFPQSIHWLEGAWRWNAIWQKSIWTAPFTARGFPNMNIEQSGSNGAGKKMKVKASPFPFAFSKPQQIPFKPHLIQPDSLCIFYKS